MLHAGHPGIIYHYLNDKNWEGFYFRPHSTGTKSAIQFTCHINGKGTYPAGNAVKVPTNGAWFNAKVIDVPCGMCVCVCVCVWCVVRVQG